MQSLSQLIHSSSDNLLSGVESTIERSGVKSVSEKLFKFEMPTENEITKIIVLLLAIIAIIVVVFFIPRLNKDASFEKMILDSKIIKLIFCCVLLYGFYHYSLKMFGVVLLITFFLFWFHHGYSVEKYGPVNMMNLGEVWQDVVNAFGEQDEVVLKKNEHGEIVVGEHEKKVVEKVEKEVEKDEKEVEIEKVEKSVDEDVKEETGFSNNSEEMYERQQQIFDQRDFMILPERGEERAQIFDRICDCTRCTKPTSFVEKEF